MMTAVAGIVLAMVAYGVVDIVMNAVVDPAVDIDLPTPATPTPDAPVARSVKSVTTHAHACAAYA